MSEVEDVVGPSSAVVHGQLKNSEMLSKLDVCFLHLSWLQHEDVVSLIKQHASILISASVYKSKSIIRWRTASQSLALVRGVHLVS